MSVKTVPPTLSVQAHRNKLVEQFGHLRAGNAALPLDTQFVFLCFTNRTGSNFLSALLASGAQWNCANECLNWTQAVKESARRNLRNFQQYFSSCVRRQQKSGLFFVKLALPHLDVLIRTGIMDQVMERSRFIMLERSDKLDQAISWAIASQTKAYSSALAPEVSPQQLEFSRTKIDRFQTAITSANEQFEAFFSSSSIDPVRVMYERLVAEPQAEAARIASELGFPDSPFDAAAVRLQKQANELNAMWRAIYFAA